MCCVRSPSCATVGGPTYTGTDPGAAPAVTRAAYPRRVSTSPPAARARFALWFSAWVGGSASLDDTRDAIVGDDAAHDVVGLPGCDGRACR